MENKKINIEFKMENMVSDIIEMKDIINKMYNLEKFTLKMSFETSYNEKTLLRFVLSNSIGNTSFNNGLLTLYHKYYETTDIENFNESEILIKFFKIQKDLKDIDIKFEISDNRD